MKKQFDLAVKIGEKKDGKAVWKNIGAVMMGDKGPFILLDRTFNPAGVPGNETKQSCLVSMFQVRDEKTHNDQLPPFDETESVPF